MRRLICAAEVVVDLVLSVPHLPSRGGDVIAQDSAAHAGGAFNVMAAARRQGVPVTYAGLVGTGPMAAVAEAALHREGIAVPLPPRPGQDTAAVVALVEPDGERSFVTTLGAEADLTVQDLHAVDLRDDDIVYVSGYGLAYPRNGTALASWLPSLPQTVTVVVDLGPLVADVPAAVLAAALARADWVTATQTEARAVVGGEDLEEVAGRLVRRVRAVAVVRAGRHGAAVASRIGRNDKTHRVPAFPVSVVDTNGAGDAHTGVIVAELARHRLADQSQLDVVSVVRRANAAAALAVTRPGPATAPTMSQIDTFLRRHGAD